MGECFPAISESQEELEELLKAERDAQIRRRLHLLVLIRSGAVKSSAAAARHLAVHRNSVRNWLLLYKSGGLEKLLHIGQGAPEAEQKSLPEPVFQALQVRLDQDGFTGGYLQVQRWLKGDFDLEVPYSTVHKLVRYRLKSKLKRARPSHVKKTRPRSLPSQTG
ncbi:MAG TPA: helix-turn-helix domain-containing protein [Longimicrobium sp.]|nr:helix-turn-helix domain-containing protein [Longimicrobium sp.]